MVLLHQAPVTNLLVTKLVEIETHHLCLGCNTEMHAGDVLERVQQDTRDNEGVGSNGCNLSELATNLHTDAVHAAEAVVRTHTIKIVDPGLAENTGEERTDHSADTVELEGIHAFVDLDPLVDVLAQRADGRGEETDKSGNPQRYVTSSGCDTNETSDGSRASTDNREMALGAHVFNRDPAEGTEGGGGVGVESREHGADGSIERTAAVEAEPPEPDEDGTDEDQGGVMGFSVDLVTLVQALAKDHGVSKGGPAGCDVDGTTTSKVERGEVE